MMEEQTPDCSNCKFSTFHPKVTAEIAQCRRFPPVLHVQLLDLKAILKETDYVNVDEWGEELRKATQWPAVLYCQSCGEHKPRD